MSSQISTCRTKPGRSVAVNKRSGPNGTSARPDPDARLARRRPPPSGVVRRTPDTSAGRTSGPRRGRGHGGSRRRCCRSCAGSAEVRRSPAPASVRLTPRRRRVAHPPPRRATRPAAGCPRSSSRTASARETPPARRCRHGSRERPAAPTRRWQQGPRWSCGVCTRRPGQIPGCTSNKSPSPSIVARQKSRFGDGVHTGRSPTGVRGLVLACRLPAGIARDPSISPPSRIVNQTAQLWRNRE